MNLQFKLIVISSLLIFSCSKSIKCIDTFSLGIEPHLVNIKELKSVPELMDTLEKYPQLQVTRIINNEYAIGFHANIYQDDHILLTETYRLFKSKKWDYISSLDTIPKKININLKPEIRLNKAIRLAKEEQKFGFTCVKSKLGIYDKNWGQSYQPKNYTLVYEISGLGGSPEVHIDANTGEIYYSDDGIRY